MSKKRMWKATLLIMLATMLGAWLCACGSGGSTSGSTDGDEDKASARESRDGFDKATNQELTIGAVTYSLPDYYELDEEQGDDKQKYYYAEYGDSVVMLYCTDPELEYSGTGDFEDYINGVAESLEDGQVDDSNTELEINGMPAACFTFHATFSDTPMHGKTWILHNKDVDTISVLMLGQSNESEYDYMKDFDKVAHSAKPVKKEKEKKTKKPKVSKDFKKTMDGYEEFFDDYVKFMKKYQNSNDTLGMLSDYADYMTKYQEVMSDLEAIDEDELSEADLAYYIEVNARIQKKLLEVSSE